MLTPDLTAWETEPLREGYDPESKESEFKIAPAKWIWLPSERTLPCTFVLFRKEFELEKVPSVARGWIAADSRYVLYVNGNRVQFGPAPHDPRHAEADPVDIARYLKPGKNVIGIHVLFYGQGDGTWPTGKPGLIFRVNLGKEVIATDKTWKCAVDRSHKPGAAKRWYLRALQECYDATKYFHGWNEDTFTIDTFWHNGLPFPKHLWHDAQELDVSSVASAISGSHSAYGEDIRLANPKRSTLKARSIPMMHEEIVTAKHIATHQIDWTGNINDWFDFRVPGIYQTSPRAQKDLLHEGSWLVTYELPFGMVGWPILQLRHNPENGATLEVMVQESWDPDHPFMDNHLFAWTRFTLDRRQGVYEPFDYESCKYIQVHMYVPENDVARIPDLQFRRRTQLDANENVIKVFTNKDLTHLLLASQITLQNSSQDIVVDGMARERQQYSGDCAHQLHAVRQHHGNFTLSKRFLDQFCHGQMLNGVWFDSWPAYDRYARLAQRQIGASEWGSLVDHSIGFVIEHVHHWLQTGDRTPYEHNRDSIRKFQDYLTSITGLDGLLKVEDIGAENVWIDHDSYQEQSHKKLALNLYALQMQVMLDWIEGTMSDLNYQIENIQKQFWHDRMGRFINNRADVATRSARYCDRSISHLLWLHAHGFEVAPSLENTIPLLINQPKALGIGYPANSVWRHWAWARLGRVDLILKEYKERWSKMHSVRNNYTIQEMWDATPGSTSQMSHCAVSPTIMMHQAVLGIGQDRNGDWFVRPQLADLEDFEITTQTPWGPINLQAIMRHDGTHVCTIKKPVDMPLYLRTIQPVSLPFHDRGHEFSSDLTVFEEFQFELAAYPPDQLIVETDAGLPTFESSTTA